MKGESLGKSDVLLLNAEPDDKHDSCFKGKGIENSAVYNRNS